MLPVVAGGKARELDHAFGLRRLVALAQRFGNQVIISRIGACTFANASIWRAKPSMDSGCNRRPRILPRLSWKVFGTGMTAGIPSRGNRGEKNSISWRIFLQVSRSS